MLFNDEFLDQIREAPVEGILAICEKVRGSLAGEEEWVPSDYEVLLEALALISSLVELQIIANRPLPVISGNMALDCGQIYKSLGLLEKEYKAETSKLKLQNLKSHFIVNMESGFRYEFSQGDLDRIQALVNELREHVSKSLDFEEDHKRRLLARLEKLQVELHKKMSDLDRFWGLIGDAGVVIGKFGNDVKPIVDRIKEITEIVWRTQARAEELPSDSRYLSLKIKKKNK